VTLHLSRHGRRVVRHLHGRRFTATLTFAVKAPGHKPVRGHRRLRLKR
jgi:hypothetical protein